MSYNRHFGQDEAVVRFLPSVGGALNAAIITKLNFDMISVSDKTPSDPDIENLVKSISSKGPIRADLARSLYSNTIRPLEPRLTNVNELTIVADGALTRFRFRSSLPMMTRALLRNGL